MKKHLFLIIGVFMLIGGLVSLSNGKIVDGVLALIIGGVLLFLWKKQSKKATGVLSTEALIQDRELELSTYNKKLKVTGVTYTNDDGTSRQKILRDLFNKIPNNSTERNIVLSPYEYEGEPACAVLVDGLRVGALKSDDAKLASRIVGISESFIGFFNEEDDNVSRKVPTRTSIFYMNITATVRKAHTVTKSK